MGFFRKNKQQTSDEQGLAANRSQMYNQIREEENQRYLKELLSRKRAPDIQKRVLDVLSHEKAILKKISIVERVDSHGVESLQYYERRIKIINAKESSKKSRGKSAYRFESPGGRRSAYPVIVPGASPQNFLKYMLREWRAISHFGRLHFLLKGRVVRRRHELTDDFLHFWNVELKVILNFIEEPVQLLVDEGWQTLDLLQHNLLVVLRDMIRYYKANTLLIFDKKVARKVYQPLVPFLEFYLQLIFRPEYKNLLLDGMLNYLKEVRSFSPVLRRILSATAALFDIRKNGPSLLNCILALDMAYYRKFVDLDILFRRFKVTPIADKNYICDSQLREKIENFVRSRENELKEFEKNISFLDGMKISSPAVMEEQVAGELFFLYAGHLKATGEQGRSPVQSGKRLLSYDLVAFISKAGETFVALGEKLLSGRVALAGIEGDKPLFNEVLFSKDIESLSERLYSLRDLRASHDRLTMNLDFYKKYIARKIPEGSYTEIERRYCQTLREMGTAFYQIALKLNHILSQFEQIRNFDQSESLDENIAEQSSETELPFATAIIERPLFFHGKSVFDSLGMVMSQSIAFSILLEEASLKALMKRRVAMEERASELKIILQRMR